MASRLFKANLVSLLILAPTLAACGCAGDQRPAPITPEAESAPLPEIRLLAVGDVNLARQCGQSLLKEGAHYPFGHLRGWIESYDLAFCNLESNISEQNGETVKPGNRLIFTSPPIAAEALKLSGWDIVATANNHAADYGLRALTETLTHLEAAGLAYCGTAVDAAGLYRPVYLEVKGVKLAFLAVTDVTNYPVATTALKDHLNLADRDRVLPALEEAERQADLTILSYHGGAEYSDEPIKSTREFLRWAVDHGVDLVLGHHPHVPQGIERRGKSLILYSLGNFTFYQESKPLWTDYGLAASITLNRDGVCSVSLIPIRAHFQARLITDETRRRAVLTRVASLSERLAAR
jgi:poly-gamma-glutamate capsule biosynthesis protein CapA/YwtB (metallophosphatase superfamily)